MIDELIPVLKEIAWPDVVTCPIFAEYRLRAQMAHVKEDWAEATEQWRLALALGRSVGWQSVEFKSNQMFVFCIL